MTDYLNPDKLYPDDISRRIDTPPGLDSIRGNSDQDELSAYRATGLTPEAVQEMVSFAERRGGGVMEYLKEIERKIIVDLKGIDKVIPKLESSLKDLKGEREHMLVALRSVQKGLKDWDVPVEDYPEPPCPGVIEKGPAL